MLPDRVSNPGPLTYESGALPIALRGPARWEEKLRLVGWLIGWLVNWLFGKSLTSVWNSISAYIEQFPKENEK